jgi:hypothetical protein
VDWLDESQMLPANSRSSLSTDERLAAIRALRKLILAPADTAKCAAFEDRSNAALERFLRARGFKIQVAAALFLEHRRWRSTFDWVQGPNNITKQLAHQVVCMQGLCKDGLPFVIVVANRFKPSGKEGIPELFRFFIYVMVRMPASSSHSLSQPFLQDTIASAMGPGGQFRLLVDLRNMSSANADLGAMKVAFNVLQKGFPERMRTLWLAEPPGLFLALWRLVSVLVAPSTKEKIQFIAGKHVKATVGKHVPLSLLPADWGGTGALRPLSAELAVWDPRRLGAEGYARRY